jgi:hypothetical protein
VFTACTHDVQPPSFHNQPTRPDQQVLPASAFADGPTGLAADGGLAWGDATLAAFRMCVGDGGAGGHAGGGAAPPLSGLVDAEEGGEPEVMLFRGGGGGQDKGPRGERGLGGGRGRDEAERAAKRWRFGELPLEGGEEFYDGETAGVFLACWVGRQVLTGWLSWLMHAGLTDQLNTSLHSAPPQAVRCQWRCTMTWRTGSTTTLWESWASEVGCW